MLFVEEAKLARDAKAATPVQHDLLVMLQEVKEFRAQEAKLKALGTRHLYYLKDSERPGGEPRPTAAPELPGEPRPGGPGRAPGAPSSATRSAVYGISCHCTLAGWGIINQSARLPTQSSRRRASGVTQ